MMQASLIGDVVGSRRSTSREKLQRRLLEVLADVTTRVGPQLSVTLGDEFQGRYPSLTTAVTASWWLHLATIGSARLRIGIGWGEILVEPEEGGVFGQDGPAWWRARDAIDRLGETSHPVRTVVMTGEESEGLINDYLAMRDLLMAGWDETDAVIAATLAEGGTQRAAAAVLGLNESSVSRRVARRHLALVVRASVPAIPDPVTP